MEHEENQNKQTLKNRTESTDRCPDVLQKTVLQYNCSAGGYNVWKHQGMSSF